MDINLITELLGDPSVYKAGSPNSLNYDGTVGWVAANQLSIINLPAGVALTADAVLAVIEQVADANQPARVFTVNRYGGAYSFVWAAPNLTVVVRTPGGIINLTNGSVFTVLYTGPDRMSELEAAIVDSHDTPPDNAFGVKILVEALNNPAAAVVADGDLVRPRASIRGALLTSAYHENATLTVDSRIENNDAPTSTYGTQVGGRASSALAGAVGADEDFVRMWLTRRGAVLGGSYLQSSTTTMEDRIEERDAAISMYGYAVGGRATLGVPAAVGDGDFAQLSQDLTSSLRVYLSQALTRASEVTSFERPPDGIAENTRVVAVATATTLAAVSTPCIAVTIYNPNAAVMGVGGATVTNARGVQIPANGFYTMEIDDLVKVYVYLAAGGNAYYTYVTRA